MNKFTLINKVMMSDLAAQDKCLLTELILRADSEGVCWPSVECLCKVRGIKHVKNFRGADYYLPGLVAKGKKGRRNVYVLNTPAIEGLSPAVTIYNTPAQADNTPATAGLNTPAQAEDTPAQAGFNSTKNNTMDSSKNDAPPAAVVIEASQDLQQCRSLTPSSSLALAQPEPANSSTQDTPATAGVLETSTKQEVLDHISGLRAVQAYEYYPEPTDEAVNEAVAILTSLNSPYGGTRHDQIRIALDRASAKLEPAW